MKFALASVFIAARIVAAGSMDHAYGTAISAESLTSTYAENEVAADGKYKGNPVSVGGIVKRVGNDHRGGGIYVELQGSSMWIVKCEFAADKAGMVAHLKVGSNTAVKGTVGGTNGGDTVVLKDCTI